VSAHQIEVPIARSARSALPAPSDRVCAPTGQPTPGMDGGRPIDTIPIGQSTRGFVQSGFCEVALRPAMLVPPCHATSQNPQDSQISQSVIHGEPS
jgi:hypothetical protein